MQLSRHDRDVLDNGWKAQEKISVRLFEELESLKLEYARQSLLVCQAEHCLRRPIVPGKSSVVEQAKVRGQNAFGAMLDDDAGFTGDKVEDISVRRERLKRKWEGMDDAERELVVEGLKSLLGGVSDGYPEWLTSFDDKNLDGTPAIDLSGYPPESLKKYANKKLNPDYYGTVELGLSPRGYGEVDGESTEERSLRRMNEFLLKRAERGAVFVVYCPLCKTSFDAREGEKKDCPGCKKAFTPTLVKDGEGGVIGVSLGWQGGASREDGAIDLDCIPVCSVCGSINQCQHCGHCSKCADSRESGHEKELEQARSWVCRLIGRANPGLMPVKESVGEATVAACEQRLNWLHEQLKRPIVPGEPSIVERAKKKVSDTGFIFEPNWASPPGDTIKDVMKKKGWDIQRFISEIGVSLPEGEALLRGDLPIGTGMATRLSEALGGTEEFWFVRGQQYQCDLSRLSREGVERYAKEGDAASGEMKTDKARRAAIRDIAGQGPREESVDGITNATVSDLLDDLELAIKVAKQDK